MDEHKRSKVELFFFATLLLWLSSISFQILLTHRTELLYVISGSIFYQTSNSLFRFFFSNSTLTDPLFVNTSVSLIHSIVTSASGSLFSLSLLLLPYLNSSLSVFFITFASFIFGYFSFVKLNY